MPLKDWTKRLNDTIDEIERSTPPGFTGDKALIVTSLRTWLATAAMPERKAISELMSQDGLAKKPAKADRTSRRAQILLQCALVRRDQKSWPEVQNLVNHSPAGTPTLGAMSMAHDAIYSGQATGDFNRNYLIAHPKEFLERFRVSVASKPAPAIYEHSFFMQDGEYRITPYAQHPPSVVRLHAMNMPATPFSQVKDDLANIPGLHTNSFNGQPHGTNLLLTTQFSGCSYCFMLTADRASLITAHIDPEKGKGVDGADIGKRLGAAGGFANGNGGVFRAYGRTQDATKFGYGDGSMIIIAVRRGGTWEIWSQLTAVSGARTVERIDNSAKPHPPA